MRTWHIKHPCSLLHGESSPILEGGASILVHAMLRDTEQFYLILFNPSVCIRWEIFILLTSICPFAPTGTYMSKKSGR